MSRKSWTRFKKLPAREGRYGFTSAAPKASLRMQRRFARRCCVSTITLQAGTSECWPHPASHWVVHAFLLGRPHCRWLTVSLSKSTGRRPARCCGLLVESTKYSQHLSGQPGPSRSFLPEDHGPSRRRQICILPVVDRDVACALAEAAETRVRRCLNLVSRYGGGQVYPSVSLILAKLCKRTPLMPSMDPETRCLLFSVCVPTHLLRYALIIVIALFNGLLHAKCYYNLPLIHSRTSRCCKGEQYSSHVSH